MAEDARTNAAPIRRLTALAALDSAAISALRKVCDNPTLVDANRVLSGHLRSVPILIVSGWAARTRMIPSGRRVMVDLALPGDLVRPIDVAGYPLCALTKLQVVAAPDASVSQSLAQAYRRSHQLTESYLMAQVARLALLDARDRLLDFATELLERMSLATGCESNVLDMPLTQWQIAEALGLTAVHINRMAQLLSREKLIHFKRGPIQIPLNSDIGRHVLRNIAAIKQHDAFAQRLPFEPTTLDQRRTVSRQRQYGPKID